MLKKKKGIELLEVIQASHNIREACQKLGISKSQYYKLLKNPEPAASKPYAPRKIGLETYQRIIDLALLCPFGCHNISYKLAEENLNISAVSVQKILQQNGLGTAKARFEALEQKIMAETDYFLNNEQKDFICKYNPALLEVGRKIDSPGELISVFTYFLGQLTWLGKVFIIFGLDASSGFVHASVSFTKDKLLCAELLEEVIFPFYDSMDVTIKTVETSKDSEYFAYGKHPFNSFLRERSVVHLLTVVGGPKTNGYCQKFQQYLLDHIVPELRKKQAAYTDLELLNEDLNQHLDQYNRKAIVAAEKYYQDFPLHGISPWYYLKKNQISV
ncbi:MAG TPA: hypothetical protein PLC89_04180 [Haliscomenobacter sp.]|uniref:hypothetical protein n=1 Tax=Haliscomenobacter sp. TaxID=2717303 RepID=UPI002B7BF198|nr:hypothetical protein [Haliscomenobacter sp.]HOY16463.1 hypothetical protein [Haliscomenobacter sp.]